MINTEHVDFQPKFDALESLLECANYLKEQANTGVLHDFLLEDFLSLSEEIVYFIEANQYLFSMNRCKDVFGNLSYWVERNLDESNSEFKLPIFIEYTLPLIDVLIKTLLVTFEKHTSSQMRPILYPEMKEFDKGSIDQHSYRCKVSIVILAYNKLEYTKQCVESVLKYTDHVEYELILVNNGSTDETQEYFESIEGAKAFYLPYNCGAGVGMNIGIAAAQGKYTAVLCNDFIFTKNWLSNLMNCIESNPNYGYVSPASNFISNFQQVNVQFEDMGEMQAFAESYNVSNPLKWEERQVLLPNVLCSYTKLLEYIGYYDPRYYFGEFADDDISFKIRRAGYKLIFCNDTFVYHYGHVTTGAEHVNHDSINKGRVIFNEKWGIDAWNDARPEVNLANILGTPSDSGDKHLLAVNSKCGCTPQYIMNRFKNLSQVKCHVHAWTEEAKYLKDLKDISDDIHLADKNKTIIDVFKEDIFDYILIEQIPSLNGQGLDEYFKSIYQLAKKGASLAIAIDNPGFIENIRNTMNRLSYMNGSNAEGIIQTIINAGFVLQGNIFSKALNLSETEVESWSRIFPELPVDQLDLRLTSSKINSLFVKM
ncbi:MAG: hypothetical protein K0R71_1145 [Bacillales bacterium]|nr:hypothetical protein [Bacillales bacterium]